MPKRINPAVTLDFTIQGALAVRRAQVVIHIIFK